MDYTMLIQVNSQKTVRLLYNLQELGLMKVLKDDVAPVKTKLSDKYRGAFSEEDAKSFAEHTRTLREEWNNI
ncbi:MAG: hypothetical protein LBU22_05480 [Dysgonamonadaceae bacterium]|jgi:hypothetical protein|nr:hypothetical protein [Dysgonamonadaceae bacterium]